MNLKNGWHLLNKIPTLEEAIVHIRNRPYMSGVDRTKDRVDATEEVFTDTDKAIDLVNRIERHRPELFTNTNLTILDPCVGDGALLGECLIRRLERGCDFESSIKSLRGLDLMVDNIKLCRKKLLCGCEHLKSWAEQYLRVGDGLKDSYSFGNPVKFGGNPELFEQET